MKQTSYSLRFLRLNEQIREYTLFCVRFAQGRIHLIQQLSIFYNDMLMCRNMVLRSVYNGDSALLFLLKSHCA